MDPEKQKAEFAAAELIKASITKSNRPGIPYLKEVLQHLVGEFGGPPALARAFHDVFQLTDNPFVKARMIESVFRLMQTEANIDQGSGDLGMLSEKDLEATVMSLVAPNAAQEETS